MKPFLFIHCIVLLSLSWATLSASEVEETLKKARAQVGTEAALKAVETLQYEGTIYDKDNQLVGQLKLSFARPNNQRLEIVKDGFLEVTAVSRYSGYFQRFDGDGKSVFLKAMNVSQVKRLQANSYENLNFFSGPRQTRSGKITLEEKSIRDERNAHLLKFAYPDGFFYARYFDADTGELMATTSSDDDFVRIEEGDIVVKGVTFPKEVKTLDKDANLLNRVVFEKILVNEGVDESLFELPSLSR